MAAPLEEDRPYRIVDSRTKGWHIVGAYEDIPEGYVEDMTDQSNRLTLNQVIEQHGPVRPVVPMPDADREELLEAFRDAGRRAAGSVIVGLWRLLKEHLDAVWSPPGTQGEPYENANRLLIAGREGSWEADLMRGLVWSAGVDLNDKARRLHEPTVETVKRVVGRWVTSPDYYVEVAEGLPGIFAEYLDEDVNGQPRGWKGAADQWMQPGSLSWEGQGEPMQRWLGSLSRSVYPLPS